MFRDTNRVSIWKWESHTWSGKVLEMLSDLLICLEFSLTTEWYFLRCISCKTIIILSSRKCWNYILDMKFSLTVAVYLIKNFYYLFSKEVLEYVFDMQSNSQIPIIQSALETALIKINQSWKCLIYDEMDFLTKNIRPTSGAKIFAEYIYWKPMSKVIISPALNSESLHPLFQIYLSKTNTPVHN